MRITGLSLVLTAVGIAFLGQSQPLGTPEKGVAKHEGGSSTEKTTTANKEAGASSNVASAVKEEQTANKHSEEEQAEENIKIQRKVASYTGWLVIAAFVTGIIVGWQAYETRRAISVSQQKERARLRIIAGPVSIQMGQPLAIRCHLENIGPTTAFLEKGGMALLRAGPEIKADYAVCASTPFVGSINPNARTPTEMLLLAQPTVPFTETDISELRNETSFVHCFGFMAYRDVFGRRHRVRLHLRWFSKYGGIVAGEITDYWLLVGQRKENSDK